MTDADGRGERGRTLHVLQLLTNALHRFEDVLLSVLLAGMIVLASLQIFLRNLFETGIGWADPLVRVLVLWLALLGALAASRGDRHINVDVLSRLLPERARLGMRSLTSLATAMICGVVAYHAARFVHAELEMATTAFANVPTWVLASVIPVAFAGIALRYLLLSFTGARAAISA
ncbi:MAG: TRAP transporter small permease subunit [Candidatus Binatia bacterium]